jgi:hypothetical protein
MYNLLLFLFMILRIPILGYGDSPESNFKEQSIFLLSNKLWNEKRFLKYGCPVITTDDKVYLHRDSDYTFIPQYSVLDSSTATEKNIYIFLEKVTNVFFHLYGQIHPRGPNYRINFIELVIEKCNNIESCQELNDCRKAVVMDSHKLSNTTIYISYSVEMYNKLMILVQYKNKHIICVDASDPLLVRKIVMNASEPQTISTSENIFRQIDQVSTSVFDPQFTLYSGNIGYIYILQCRFCTTELTINCQNGDPLITVDASNTSKIVFSDGSVVEGWQKINFSQTLHKKTYTNCSLVFTTNTTNDFPITHFWIIDRCVVDITKPAENESTTEKMNEDKNSEVDDSDNFYKKAFYSLLVLNFIIVFIIFIRYIILRSRRSVHQPNRLQDFELGKLFERREERQTLVCRKRSNSSVN